MPKIGSLSGFARLMWKFSNVLSHKNGIHHFCWHFFFTHSHVLPFCGRIQCIKIALDIRRRKKLISPIGVSFGFYTVWAYLTVIITMYCKSVQVLSDVDNEKTAKQKRTANRIHIYHLCAYFPCAWMTHTHAFTQWLKYIFFFHPEFLER